VKDTQRILHNLCACHPACYQPSGARTEKVARLKDAVSHGVYRVDARKVAQALLNQPFTNQMILQVISNRINYRRIASRKNN
jgi:hypothetical protein